MERFALSVRLDSEPLRALELLLSLLVPSAQSILAALEYFLVDLDISDVPGFRLTNCDVDAIYLAMIKTVPLLPSGGSRTPSI